MKQGINLGQCATMPVYQQFAAHLVCVALLPLRRKGSRKGKIKLKHTIRKPVELYPERLPVCCPIEPHKTNPSMSSRPPRHDPHCRRCEYAAAPFFPARARPCNGAEKGRQESSRSNKPHALLPHPTPRLFESAWQHWLMPRTPQRNAVP